MTENAPKRTAPTASPADCREPETAATRQGEAERKLKSDFLANMSHEMRTPLNAIIGMTDLTLATELTPKQKEYVSVIRSSSRALLGLINDILDFSKIESGKLGMEKIPFNLGKLIAEVVGVVGNEASQKGLELHNVVKTEVPHILVGDPLRLKQVLLNLLGNAVKFTASGGVSLETEVVESRDKEVVLRFTVRDTGIGVAPETASRLFNPFSQADGSTTRKYGGTGLGLAICRRLVHLMGGEIDLASEPGRGSTFFFTAVFRTGPSRRPEPRPDRNQGEERRIQDALAGAFVLVAEDNPVNLTVIFEILRGAGVKVAAAENGRRAVEAVRNKVFDAALMDVQMPLMDGLDAARAIRELNNGKNLPIIALTAHAMREDRDQCLAAGMDDYLSKPITRDALLRALAQWIASGRRPSGTPAPAPETTAGLATNAAPGVDAPGAATRLGLAENELAGVLAGFAEDFRDVAARVREALDRRAEKEAAGVLHTLAGAAANVSAAALAAEARRLRERLTAGDAAGTALGLDALEDALESALADIARLAGRHAGEPSSRPPVAPQRRVRELQARQALARDLERADPVGALREFEAWREVLGENGEPDLLERLEILIEDYDLEEAAALLASLDEPAGEGGRP